MTIKKQVINGVKWTTIGTIVIAFSAVLKISVLARYLDKSDFGLMAIVSFVISFMNLFNDMGLTSAIMHKQNISKNEYASLYWINILISVFLFLLLFLITPFISKFYDQPQLNLLIPLLGINLILSGIGGQFKTIENKNLLFKQIAIIDISASLVSLIFAVFLAMNSFGVFSLVYSSIMQFLISNIFYFIVGYKKYGLIFRLRFDETRPFIKIGVYQVGGQISNYFNRDFDILVIGKFFSPAILGGYSLAKQLVFRPAQIISPIVLNVATPALATMQENLYKLKHNYLRVINILSSVNIPIYIVLILFSPLVVRILYGGEFENIIPLVRILSIYMILRSIGSPVGSLFIATGRTDLDFIWNLILLAIFPIFIIVGSYFGVLYVAGSITFCMILLYIPSWKFLINKLTGATLKEYLIASFILDFKFLYNRKRRLDNL